MEQQQSITLYDLFMSDAVDQLATALCKAQGEFSVATKNQKNPYYKSLYADFEAIVNASRPAMVKYGLSFVQSIITEDNHNYLVTILLHSSGQWIKSKAQHNPPKSDIQSLSSYNTYLKRMCLQTLIGVVTSNEDDDGEVATAPLRQSPTNNFHQNMTGRINETQLEIVNSLSETTKEKILEFNKINSLNELTVEQYDKIMTMLKNRKQ